MAAQQKQVFKEKTVPYSEVKKLKASFPHIEFGKAIGPIGPVKTAVKINFIEIAIVSPDGDNVQLTLHRPIGVTDLDPATDWVLTETAQIKGALRRQEDEAKDTNEKLAIEQALKLTLEEKFLIKEAGEIYYAQTEKGKLTKIGDIPRNQLKVDYSKFIQEAESQFRRECREKNPGVYAGEKPDDAPKNWVPRKYPEFRKPPYEFSHVEDLIKERFKKELSKLTTFRTKVGSRGEIPQKSFLKAGSQDAAKQQLIDLLLSRADTLRPKARGSAGSTDGSPVKQT